MDRTFLRDKTMVVTRSRREEIDAIQFELERAQGLVAAGGQVPEAAANQSLPTTSVVPGQENMGLTTADTRNWREKRDAQLRKNEELFMRRETVGEPSLEPYKRPGGIAFTVSDIPQKAPMQRQKQRSLPPGSVTSLASSTEVRRREAELEAKRKLIEIKRRELALEEELVHEELAATIERIELEGSRTGSVTSKKRVEEWVGELQRRQHGDRTLTPPRKPYGETRCRSQSPMKHNARAEGPVRENAARKPTHGVTSTPRWVNENATRREPSAVAAPPPDFGQLMSQWMNLQNKPSPPSQVYDLPLFNGEPGEWLNFYSAYSESTLKYKFSPWENLARLRQCLKGDARNCVMHMLASSANPELIIRVLKKNFGRTNLLVDRALEELRRMPNLGPTANDLNNFAIKIMNIVSTLMNIDQRSYADNPFLIREITERLSPHIRSRWCQYAEEKMQHYNSELVLMAEFLLEISDKEIEYSHARAPPRRSMPAPLPAESRGPRRVYEPKRDLPFPTSSGGAIRKHINHAQTYVTDKADPCLCCGGSHRTTSCRRVLSMSVSARWDWAKNNKICFKCLDRKHRREHCKAKGCEEPDCPHSHHRLLHQPNQAQQQYDDSPQPRGEAPPPPQYETTREVTARAPASRLRTSREHTMTAAEQEMAPPTLEFTSTTTPSGPSKVLLKVIPIILTGPKGEMKCYALLDEGSTISLCEESIAAAIGAEGTEAPLHVMGIGAMTISEPSRKVQMQIRGLTGGPIHQITMRTVRDLGLRAQCIPKVTVERYTHLHDLYSATYDTAVPRVLVGADNWHMMLPLEARVGRRSEPAAVRTELGWAIYGCAPHIQNRTDQVLHIREPKDGELNKLLERYFHIDSLGVKMSEKARPLEERAVKLFHETVRKVSGPKYEVGQLWKDDNPRLPPSYGLALNRLRNIERKMDRDPKFAADYSAQMDNLLEKGYAQRINEPKLDSRAWYLPHFGVTNLNKPNRIRLVFDAAAVSQGKCLNDFILEGPDLLQSLLGIIFRFREGAFAVTSDVQEMFLRVQIRDEDRASQMFLWRGSRRTGAPDVYVMKSMVFGAASSPFLAHMVRNKNAIDHEQQYPRATEDIVKNHYMDDYVASYSTETEAIECAKQVTACHKEAGFYLRGWASNSQRLIEQIPEELRAVKPAQLGDKNQKILGLMWDAGTDQLGFNTKMIRVPAEVKAFKRSPTKREALSAVMSIYDPLGLISYFSISVKIQLQRLWSLRLGWDDPLPETECREFQTWLRALEHVSRLRLPRHYGPTNSVRRTLHIFVDASSQAYACAAYWRIEQDGAIHVILIAAKAKVAPTRPLSIPRMELQAALIGARLQKTIVEQHRYEIANITLWSDSKTVLHWVRENARRYSTYVAHRLGEIAELTEPEQWRWVPTKDNPADDATRADNEREFDANHRWFRGPDFLWRPVAEWPSEPACGPEPDPQEIELRQCLASREIGGPLPNIERFSSYDRLVRATTRMVQFIEILKTKTKTQLQVKHILGAECLLLQRAQREDFADELRSLSRGEPLNKKSVLFDLDPEIGTDGVLRMRGRIDATPAPINKRPAILHGRNRLCKLLILKAHKEAAHANNERVVNDIRQQFWILRLRPTVRSVASQCQYCRIRRASPRVPPMGNLPIARIEPYFRAFTNTGLDYFGHVTVTIGRRHEKRWVALYTCLTTRAVHLELVHSLSTDSAVMSLRRMAARRGWPRTIWSDNATNFKGATAELRAAYEEWLPALQQYGLQRKIDWRFIPPGAPNQGGAWERMVRSIKVALQATLHTRAPKEEVLVTLLAEAEACVNARPLTHVSVEPGVPEALTPNHFLLGGPTGTPVTGPCGEADRKTWRVSQALADHFWRRWVREYLPTLAPRRSSPAGERPLAVGDLVVVVDPTLPRNVWPRGVVEQVYKGPDGGVRSAEVRTKGGVFRRPTTRLAVLPVEPESTQQVDGGSVNDSQPKHT